MAPIGQSVERTGGAEILARAKARAALVPDCLVEARRIANTVSAGWHGRRRRGIGENFWQFRPYSRARTWPASTGDGRRARDDHTYVRDKEWQAAHTVWLWADLSGLHDVSFEAGSSVEGEPRARPHAGARRGAGAVRRTHRRAGLMEPVAARNAAERLARSAAYAENITACPTRHDQGFERDRADRRFSRPAGHDHGAHRAAVAPWVARRADHGGGPRRIRLPLCGRTEFTDPETGEKFTAAARRYWPRNTGSPMPQTAMRWVPSCAI